MGPVVSLRDVVNEMDTLNDDYCAYLNRCTGELFTIREEDIAIAEEDYDLTEYPEWQHEVVKKTREVLESKDFVPLPSKFDIHEYSIMERFCYSIEDKELSEELIYQIRGSGAFGRFKAAIHDHNIADAWYQFRQQAFEEIAVEWLEAHGIAYRRDDEVSDDQGV